MTTMIPQSKSLGVTVLALALLGWLASAPLASAQGTAFTYQGRVIYQGFSANGNLDLTFGLFDSASGGAQIGSTLTNLSLPVSNGLFTVTLDFGTSAFPGADRWLELGVRTNGSDPFTVLSPRQQLTPSPYAVTAGGFTGTVQDSQLSGNVARLNATQTFTGQNTLNNAANSFGGDGSGLTGLSAGNISSGTLGDGFLSANVPLLSAANTFSGTNVFTGGVASVFGGTSYYMVPQGGIIIWSGSTANIPSGWALCNGTQGTPDLRDKFVVGAGNSYSVAATGGATSHTHDTAIGTPTTSTAGAHTHTTTASTTGSESGHTHSIDPPSTTTGSAGAHTHGWGTLSFGRQVDFTGPGGSSGGPWIISVYSSTSTSPQFDPKFTGGATASGGSHTHSVDIASFTSGSGSAHSHSIPALTATSAGDHSHTVSIGTITSTSASSLPPYYALCYIMKL